MNTKLLGSALIVSGTALGAGMLAIPMVLAQFGLAYGSLLMAFIWFGTTYAALLLLEATIKSDGGIGLNSIARKLLGRSGQWLSNSLLYALLICLLMAYILGAADLLAQLLSSVGLTLSQVESQVMFTLAAGAIVTCGTGVIDKLNRVLFMVMILCLVLTLGALLPQFSFTALQQVSNHDHFSLIETSSVLFTSFGFMVVIPSLVTYNNEATDKQLRNMIILGSIIPLVCYLCWLFAVVGSLPAQQLKQFTNVSELMSVFQQQTPWIGNVLSLFIGLALLTSFFGVAMALFHQNSDALGSNRTLIYVVTFILPLLGAIGAADKFLSVLAYAGIILVLLAVGMPLIMVIKARRAEIMSQRYRAEGGTSMLIFSLLFGVFLITSQLL
ncbi:aromatic amino acid transport family protein [Vibrio sp. NH-UV-68]|uniref:amino acid permease n=1 Tax=unclassified Vibrio TaxID=2614977 RepID=UPI0036F400DE